MEQYTKPQEVINTLRPGLCGDNPLTMIRLPHRSLSSQSLGKYLQLEPEQPKEGTHTNSN